MDGPVADGLTPATAAALAFVADLERPELEEGDAHHLRRVLRLRRGEPIAVSDGMGSWRICRLGEGLTVASEVVVEPVASPQLTVGFSIPKVEKPELVVQKLTELGIDRIALIEAERTVVRWKGQKAQHHVERLQRVARGAAMQARRTRLPTLLGPVPFAVAAAWPGATRCDRGGAPLSDRHSTVLVGPEGGWAGPECARLPDSVGLAPYILRVETAAIAVAALQVALRSRAVLM
jgi:16S rRNA (uracil1498-N3)-methyltransferase